MDSQLRRALSRFCSIAWFAPAAVLGQPLYASVFFVLSLPTRSNYVPTIIHG